MSKERPLNTIGLSLLILTGSFLLFFTIYSSFSNLNDGDSYYHMAVAREYSKNFNYDHLPWARYSAMKDRFGDKEILFHWFIASCLWWKANEQSSKCALALLDALIVASIAFLSIQAIGYWGVLVPIWILGTSADFCLRLTCLRPELLSLLILLWATWFAYRKKFYALLFFSIFYALSHTSFQAYLGIALGWFVFHFWLTKRLEYRLVIYPALGVLAGLILHPHFPANLWIWKIQNVDFFRYKSILDVGTEFQPLSTATFFSANIGWLLGLLVFSRSTEPSDTLPKHETASAYFCVSAAAFFGLYMLMQRFSTLSIPFVTLFLLFEIRRRGHVLGSWTYLPWRGKIPFIITFSLCLCMSMNSIWLVYFNLKEHAVFRTDFKKDWRSLNQKIPENAKVASPWREAEYYVWAVPQAQFLNLLDPVFMLVPNPKLYWLQKQIWQGSFPDVPFAVKDYLDSDFILFPYGGYGKLYQRLCEDPRTKVLYRGNFNILFQILPNQNSPFITDWKLMTRFSGWPPTLTDIQNGQSSYFEIYPQVDQKIEGYVHAQNYKTTSNMLNFVHLETITEPQTLNLEFAPYGPASLWLDKKLILSVQKPLEAILGQGIFISLALEKGDHLFAVQTQSYQNQNGFFLLTRSINK